MNRVDLATKNSHLSLANSANTFCGVMRDPFDVW